MDGVVDFMDGTVLSMAASDGVVCTLVWADGTTPGGMAVALDGVTADGAMADGVIPITVTEDMVMDTATEDMAMDMAIILTTDITTDIPITEADADIILPGWHQTT